MTVWIADFENGEGVNGFYQTEQLANRLAIDAVDQIIETTAFTRLAEIAEYELARTFFLVRCKTLIWPLARAYVVASNSHSGDQTSRSEVVTSDPVLYGLLAQRWPSSEVPLRLISNSANKTNVRLRLRRWMRRIFEALPSRALALPDGVTASVGVECDQLELSRGSLLGLLNCLPPNETILCPFFRLYAVRPSTFTAMKESGFHWVSVAPGAIAGKPGYWRPGPFRRQTAAIYSRSVQETVDHNPLEDWAAIAARSMLWRVDYWRMFFRRNRIRVYIHYAVSAEEGIAKQIALSLENGVLVMLQRSHLASHGNSVGRRPAHVAFSWGNPEGAVGTGNNNRNDAIVVTGFDEEAAFTEGKRIGRKYRDDLAQAGASFVVGLFDNSPHPDAMYKSGTLSTFYRYFLTWLLENEENGLIIKPKRNFIPRNSGELRKAYRGLVERSWVEDLSSLGDLFEAAEATGRCLVLDEGNGAHTAAFGADLCVGLGHSTTIVMSALAGRRAVHCDLGKTPSNPLTRWGLGKVVFHDLDSLFQSIKAHKLDPANSTLGDFSSVLDDFDPFRDGRAKDRMDQYLRDLLEAFAQGLDRSSAIEQANQLYAGAWGSDKVIRPKKEYAMGTVAS